MMHTAGTDNPANATELAQHRPSRHGQGCQRLSPSLVPVTTTTNVTAGNGHQAAWGAGREHTDGSVVPGSIPERSHLDLGGSRERMSGRYLDGRVQIGALDDVIASDLLFGLGKRSVTD
jgi:hypothetical protein